MDSNAMKPTGHLQVRPDKNGRTRSYHAFWEDAAGKHAKCLGRAHVKDTGRKTPRGAVIWRAGDGPKPTPKHLTPREAEARLEQILKNAENTVETTCATNPLGTLRGSSEGWLAERRANKDLKRSTVEDYEEMFERLYRDHGAETPIIELTATRLESYFADFKAERVLPKAKAEKALAEGKDVRELDIERWVARPPGTEPIVVSTRGEAVRQAKAIGGTWKHSAPGTYTVRPPGAGRPRRVSWTTAQTLQAEGWTVSRRATRRWVIRTPAAPQTRNKYRDILAAIMDYAVRQGWLESHPLAAIGRTSLKHVRHRILRREDFYTREEVVRLRRHAPGMIEEALWLLGAHAGLRLPGEAQGLRRGAVDFEAGVIRVYDNWVRNAPDTTKTDDSIAIPMTPRLAHVLAQIMDRDYATEDNDHVLTRNGTEPVDAKAIRAAFKHASKAAGLKPIKMYNLRHSFGTGLAREGVDIRTIQALMRHARITTTEQYMAYAPQPDLANRLTRALDPLSTEESMRLAA